MENKFLEPIKNYTFGRGIQKNSNGKFRWWKVINLDTIYPDFEISKLGPVEELLPDVAMSLLIQNNEKWQHIYINYPQVRQEMDTFSKNNKIQY